MSVLIASVVVFFAGMAALGLLVYRWRWRYWYNTPQMGTEEARAIEAEREDDGFAGSQI